MSDDPTPPPPPEPVPPTPEGLSAESRGLKRRYKKPEPSEAGGGDPDGEIIILSSLLQNLLERKQGGSQPPPPEGETRAKVNRFIPRGNPGPAPAEPGTTAPEAAPTTVPATPTDSPAESAPGPKKETQAAESAAAVAFPKFEPRAFTAEPPTWERTGSTWGRGILYFAFAAALALGAFLVGRSDAHHADEVALGRLPVVGLTDLWSPVYTEPLDKALAADHGGDLPTALRLTDELAKNMKPNPVLQAYRATLNTRLGHTNDVEADLSRMLNPTTAPADAAVLNAAQGFNYARRREFDHAIDCFAAAATVRPFDTDNLLHLAEAYRRKGRLTDAIDTFRTAILRLPLDNLPHTEARREYLSYEERLTLVENGRDAEFKDELAKHLAATPPAPEWLLTAAASALQRGDLPTAVDTLTKAQALLAPDQFRLRMSDYFFRAFAYHPEMNAFLEALTPEQQRLRQQRMDFYLDP